MQFKIPHKSNQAEAISRIERMLKDQKDKIAENASDVKADWAGNVLTFAFTAQGTHISGTLTVTDTEYEVYAKLPLMYKLFEGTIERMIQAEAAKLGM